MFLLLLNNLTTRTEISALTSEMDPFLCDLPIEVDQLGTPNRQFTVPTHRVLRSLFMPFAFIGGVALLLVGQMGLLMGWGGWPNVPTLLFLMCIGFVLVTSGGGTMQLALQNCGARFIVLSQGLARVRKSRIDLYRWDEITDVWQFQWPDADFTKGLPRKFTATIGIGHSILRSGNLVKLRRKDGRKLRLDDFIENVDELINIIQFETAKAMLPTILAKFEAGNALSFGKLRIDQDGISRGTRDILWSDVREIKQDRHMLLVYQQGKSVHAIAEAYHKIPNLHVFLALVRHALKAKDSEESSPTTIT